MKMKIAYKNVKHSPNVDEKISYFSEKLAKYWPGEVEAKWYCSFKDTLYFVEVHITGPHCSYHAKAYHQNFYKAFDSVTDKMEKQLIKHKGKFRDSFKHKPEAEFYPDEDVVWEDYSPEYYKVS